MSSLSSVDVDNLLADLFKLVEDISWKARFIDQFKARTFSNAEIDATSSQALIELNTRLSQILAAYIVSSHSKYPDRLRSCVHHEVQRRQVRSLGV